MTKTRPHRMSRRVRFSLGCVAVMVGLVVFGAMLTSWLVPSEYLSVLPSQEELAGIYAFDQESHAEMWRCGYFAEGTGQLVLLADGTAKCIGGSLQVFLKSGNPQERIVMSTVIPPSADSGTWETEQHTSGAHYIRVIYGDKTHAAVHQVALYVKRTPSGLVLCPMIDAEYCVAPLRRIAGPPANHKE